MSYRKIFSVVNEHTASTVVVRYAISLALAVKAELVLYAAHEKSCNETILRNTDRHLDHLAAVASKLDVPVTRISEIGNISTLLPNRMQTEKGDLLFYPLTPYERYGATLQQNTVHHLLRTIGTDLVIMRAVSMAKPHPGNILVPLGKVVSEKERRLFFLSELARSFHAKVTLFHLYAERDAEGIPDEITRLREQLQKQGVTVLVRSARGDIGTSITVEAITRHNDLVVLGATGRGILRRLFSGNPADDVMHRSPCNVMLFRAAP